jgi:PEP-CTERM motif
MKRTILAGFVLMGMLAMPALAYEELAVDDAMITDGNDTPNGTELQHCLVSWDPPRAAMIMQWDLSAYPSWDAVGDATFRLNVGWMADNPTPIRIYELTGGAFDETTVTAVNYCTDGLVGNVLGDLATSALIDTTGNFVYNLITIPQATMDKLLKGTIAGLAITNQEGAGMNACIRTQNTDWTLHAEPMLTFDAVVPEPATLSLLALGGVVALIRRK